MDRFWISPEHWREPFCLREEGARHCGRVMRKRVGDVIEVFDGDGRWARGRIRSVERSEVVLDIEESGESPALSPRIEIAVGIPKGKTFDLVIQKAVELGVEAIHPILSEQGMVKISASDAAKKREKWQRVALEACKQCGQNKLPRVSEPRELTEFLKNENDCELQLVGALLPGVRPMKEVLTQAPELTSIRLMVGPEGDFSKEEYDLILVRNYQPISLGPLVLRVETAILAMISSVRYQFH